MALEWLREMMMTLEQIKQMIGAATAKEKMSPHEALEFLEDLDSDIAARIEGLRSDIQHGG